MCDAAIHLTTQGIYRPAAEHENTAGEVKTPNLKGSYMGLLSVLVCIKDAR